MPNPTLHILCFALDENFTFELGQYVTVGTHASAELTPRPYSIAYSPNDSRSLEFYRKSNRPGDRSSHLLDLKPGQSVGCKGTATRKSLRKSGSHPE